MGSVIIDSRSFKLLPEALEACRLSACDTIVLSPVELDFENVYPGVLWSSSKGEFDFALVDCDVSANSIMDKIYMHAGEGDLVITGDIGVAAFAIDEGSRAIDFFGREYDPKTIKNRLSRRNKERKLRASGVYMRGLDLPGASSDDAQRMVAAIRSFVGVSTHPAAKGDDPRILIDADNVPLQRVLPVAHSFGVPVAAFFNGDNHVEKGLLLTDPVARESADGGFWVDLVPAPPGKDAADQMILERCNPGDLVLTGDGPLAWRSLEIGCSVMDRYGIAHRPDDMTYFRNEHDFRRSRRIRRTALKEELNSHERVVRFMNCLFDAMGTVYR